MDENDIFVFSPLIFNFFSQFYHLILDWLRNKLHDLFFIVFYRVIIVSNKYLFFRLMFNFVSIYFYYIIKKIFYKKLLNSI